MPVSNINFYLKKKNLKYVFACVSECGSVHMGAIPEEARDFGFLVVVSHLTWVLVPQNRSFVKPVYTPNH